MHSVLSALESYTILDLTDFSNTYILTYILVRGVKFLTDKSLHALT